MRLVYLANIRLPTEKAHGLQIMKMCEAFAQNGLSVELVVPKARNSISGDPFEFYSVARNFKITHLPVFDAVGLLPFGFLIRQIWFLFSARKYCRKFAGQALIYSRDPFVPLFFPATFLELHQLPPKMGWWFRKSLSRAAGVVALTSFIAKILVQQGLSEQKVMVAPDAADFEMFGVKAEKPQARQALALPSQGHLIGYVGTMRTMNMEKGIGTAIGALQNLPSDCQLVLVGGEKADIDQYRRQAADLGVGDRIIFIGRVKHDKVPQYLAAFDVLVAPYPDGEHYRHFMSPLKIFEYMASGRPVVVSDLPTMREVLSEKSAYFFRPEDSAELAEKISLVLADPVEAQNRAGKARELAQANSWLKRAEKIGNFLESVKL